MKFRSISMLSGAISLSLCAVAGAVEPASAPMPTARPTIAKVCTNCHKAEQNTLRGNFDNISFKTKTIQLKIDDAVELLKFDEKTLAVINEEKQSGDVEFLKNNKLKKGHEIKVDYSVANGVKTAIKLTAKPPVELPKDLLASTAVVEKLVALGPEKGKYFLYDSRPAPRFLEGTIPTAVNLPFPAFDKLAEKLLPADKSALIIFFCSGVTCNMSPGSATKAQKLGYKNIKVYKEGMPAWSEKHYGVLTAQAFKDAFLDKGISHVLLDVRPARDSAKGFIKGAVSFPSHHNAAPLIKKMVLKQKKAPIVVYDDKGGVQAIAVAKELVKAGYGNVKVMTGGFDAWKGAQYMVASGKPATKVVFVPTLRPGEIEVAEFKKYAASLPDNVMIVDVRPQEETNAGMLKNAKALPLTELRERVGELPKDKLVVFQCNTGTLAEMAYHTSKELGLKNVKYLNAKLKIEKNGAYEITMD
ncbi:MAG: rhodanese-like domain-containing protein [Pelobacteraceae bacterium]